MKRLQVVRARCAWCRSSFYRQVEDVLEGRVHPWSSPVYRMSATRLIRENFGENRDQQRNSGLLLYCSESCRAASKTMSLIAVEELFR